MLNALNLKHDPRRCNAFQCAAENSRDANSDATLTQLDQEAEGYVRDGLTTCTCPSMTAAGSPS